MATCPPLKTLKSFKPPESLSPTLKTFKVFKVFGVLGSSLLG